MSITELEELLDRNLSQQLEDLKEIITTELKKELSFTNISEDFFLHHPAYCSDENPSIHEH